MIEALLERARSRSQAAEVFALTLEETPVAFEANILKEIHTRQIKGLALRLVVEGRVGFASSTRVDQPDVLIESALEVSPFGAEARFEFPGSIDVSDGIACDPVVANLSAERLAEMGREMIASVRESVPEALCDARISRTRAAIEIENSRGGQARYEKATLSVMLSANLIRGTDMLDVFEYDSTSRGIVDHLALAGEVIRTIRLAERTATIRTGVMPVVFTPKGVADTLVLPLRLALSGKTVLEGASPWAGKLGHTVVDSGITLYDDGRAEGSTASAPFDDEGSRTRRTSLIEKGVVKSFYYDLRTAGLAGIDSTGNASRSLDTLPTPAPTTWLFEGGDVDEGEMVAGLREGLLVDQTMGAWAGNVVAGEFSGNVHLGYKIENGELVGRVKDSMVTGNVFRALNQVGGIGRVPHRVGSEVIVPMLLFEALGVASKSQSG